MEKYLSGMPLWATVLFIIVFLYSIMFIASPAKKAALDAGLPERKAARIRIGIFLFYVLYLAYVSALALNGAFAVDSILPRAMVYAGIPLMIVLFGWIGNTRLFNQLLRSVSLESLITIHVFRLAGVFFLLLYAYHLLPRAFALSAGLGDIITAILAIPVAKMVSKRKPTAMTAVYAWNIFGILDIANLLAIAVISTLHGTAAGADERLREMTFFPFSWFAAFAPATIFFLHYTIFRKLGQLNKANKLATSLVV